MKNQYRFAIIFVLITALFFAAAAARAQGIGDRNRPADSNGGIYSIQGRVILPDGKPAENVKVSITSADGPGIALVTNQDGGFQTGGVAAGNYTIVVRVPGLPSQSEVLTIDRDAPAGRTFNVVLYPGVERLEKGEDYAPHPLIKDVPKAALNKFKKAEDKLQDNDTKAAIQLFDEAIAEYPQFALAYYERGTAYLKTNNFDKALESFVMAVQIKNDYLGAKYSVGYTQYLKNNFEVAAAIFDDVLKQKDMPEAHLYLGISLAKLHALDPAIPHLKAAIAANDNESMALAHRYLGGIYMQKKQNAEAATELEKYLKLAPKAPDADKLKSTIADLRKNS